MHKLNQNKSNYAIVGDFNIDALKYNVATYATDHLNTLASYGCKLFVDKATRVTADSATCIDHVYSNLSAHQLETDILMSDVSDHYGTLTKITGFRKSVNNAPI